MSETAHAIPTLDAKGLREFGIVTGAIVAVLFGLFFPWVFDASFPLWPWVFFAVFAAWGLAAPNSLSGVYRVWMRFGLLMSKVTTPLIMGAVFYLVIAPVALILRVVRWDAMRRKFDPAADSYRIGSRSPTKESLERPF